MRTFATVAAAALTAMLGLAAPAAAGGAGPVPYLDDRSSADALIRSLYNAINRHEYARAWTYFANPPAASFEAYVAGYADTEYVEVATGAVRADGAAGSIYYTVPVAISARAADGDFRTFAGCYTVRLVQPSIQDPPVRPMQIESGRLMVASGSLRDILPDCGDGGLVDPDGTARVNALFLAGYSEICTTTNPQQNPGGFEPEVHDIDFMYDGDTIARTFRLYGYLCYLGAYNAASVYYIEDDYGEIRQLQFAQPSLDIDYRDELNEVVDTVRVTGFSVSDMLVNATYDPETLTFNSFSKWRGLGDASATGIYTFDNGSFRLVRYDVDASYDGQFNPKTVFEAP